MFIFIVKIKIYILKANSSENGYLQDVTFLSKTITLFSNGYYLDITSDKENTIEFPYMRIQEFKIIDNNYYFIYLKKNDNNILSMQNLKIRVNKNKAEKNEIFILKNIPDSCNDILNISFLSQSSLNFKDFNIMDEKSFLSEKIIDEINSEDIFNMRHSDSE